MDISNLNNFCADRLWEPNLTWYSEQPKLTQCLSQLGFTIIPNFIFWLFVPIEIIRINRSINFKISYNFYNLLRFFVTALGILLNGYQVYEETKSIINPDEHFYLPSDLLGAVSKFLSFIILFILFIYHRTRGLITSGVIWTFLLFNCMFTGLIVSDFYLYNASSYLSSEFYVNIFNFFLNALLFIICSFTDDAYQAGLRKKEIDKEDKYEEIKKDDKLDKDRYDDNNDRPSPESYQSFFSRIMYSWFTKVVWVGRDGSLTLDNLWALEEDIKIDKILNEFEKTYNHELDKFKMNNKNETKKKYFSSFRLLKVIVKQYGLFFLGGSLAKLVHDLFQFLNPKLLELLIGFIKGQEDQMKWHGFVIVALMLFGGVMKSLLINLYFERMMKIGMKLKSNIINQVYKKSLRLSSCAKRERTTGEIVNLISVDANRFLDVLTFLNLVWSAPLQIILCIYFLYEQLGNAVFVGVMCIIAIIPINGYLINLQKKVQFEQMKYKDERIKLMNEILAGVKILKLYAWELKFMDRVSNVRKTETDYIKKNYYINLASIFFFTSTTALVSIASFTFFIFSSKDNVLTPEKAFVSITLFAILQFPINLLPVLFNFIILAGVALKRINRFLNAEELFDYATRDFDAEHAISIEGKPSFIWDAPDESDANKKGEVKVDKKIKNSKAQNGKETNGMSNGQINASEEKKENFSLKDIEFKIKKNSFVTVIGQVGSGKSSLLSAILGEMKLKEDSINKCKINISNEMKICYGPQIAWIMNNTLRDNILFGNEFDQKKYEEVLESCALLPDLEVLPGKDLVEIGEKGINLSGGQKQRINLARVCYQCLQQDADQSEKSYTVLLDDVLSAVDAHVGKHLIENVLSSKTGILKHTTRILVTNQLTVLKSGSVDQILVMKDGKIFYDLTYEELMKLEENGELAKLGITLKQADSSSDTESEKDDHPKKKEKEIVQNKKSDNTIALADRKLIDREKLETQEVKLKDYQIYIRNAGYILSACCILFYICEHSLTLFANVFLSKWTNTRFNETQLQNKDWIFEFNKSQLAGYALITLGQSLANLTGNCVLITAAISTSIKFHRQLLKGILRSPMSFFDTTPLGRIINRFARDIEVIDGMIPQTSRTFISCMFKVVAALFIIIYTIPKVSFSLIGVLVVYYFIQKLYVTTSRQLKRLESITRSPIYSNFSETITGTSTIRAYKANERFINQANSKISLNNKCYWLSIIGYRWLGIRLDFLGNVVIFFTALFVVFERDNLDAGTVGLIVSYAMNITVLLTWSVRMVSELETNVVSVERINEYSNNKEEDLWEKDYKPPSDWPSKGIIDFNNYSTRYREGTNLVLKNLNFKVESKEKVGIVGRTGAGKSSITLALFRIIEPVEGQIIIDNIDISQLGLHSLRDRLSIIPQDPVLFSGTIRFNLDPFDKHTDEEIWKSLESAHLKNYIKSLNDGLEHLVAEGGENLSIGQRQLICLARALLKKSSILVLDEATASVDNNTDQLIQETIRKEFKDCTTITIAHRINTILDSTRILVLEKGEKLEYETPEVLLNDSNSLFYALAKSANEI